MVWPQGQVWACQPNPRSVAQTVQTALASTSADAFLFWDVNLGEIPVLEIQRLLQLPDDLWHAGLKLGLCGLPEMIDFVAPTWMLNRDPDENRAAASWRVSLRACLVRSEVLRQVEFVDSHFETLDAAALEWGHRCFWRGVLCRYEPGLVASKETKASLPLADELRFVVQRFGRRWGRWASMRAILSGNCSVFQMIRAWQARTLDVSIQQFAPYQRLNRQTSLATNAAVSVLIPTVDRYPYLRTLLEQLRHQTVPATEVIIVDQTSASHRQPELYADFPDLPLKLIYQNDAGQCSSRNAGLQASHGDYILFIDDDDEIPVDLIEKHLLNLQGFDADASCGVAHEVGAGSLPETFTYLRISDVFPTNNSMIRQSALQQTGLFDLAYDHGARADADLGMRLYLSGARMILNPDIAVLHHHASRGGLRLHKARVITYASSRRHITESNLPSVSELYLTMRYFTPYQTVEKLWLAALGTFSLHGSRLRQMLKVIVGFVMLPSTIKQLRHRRNQAEATLRVYPQFPDLRKA